jgi:hypothetical protein
MYYQLSCACLSLRSIFDSPETATVQAVALLAAYNLWGAKEHTMDTAVGTQLISAGVYLTFPVSGL